MWWWSTPGWCPASIVVMIARCFHLARSVCPTGGQSARSAPSASAFPNFPQAFTMISLWWRWDVALHAALCPTMAGRSPSPRNVPRLRGEPTGISSLLPLLISLSFTFFFYPSLSFFFLPLDRIELSKALTETFIKHPHSYWLGGQRG